MRVFINPQEDVGLLAQGYTVEVHVVSDDDVTDTLDIQDFLSFADALLWAQTKGYEVCVYQSQ